MRVPVRNKHPGTWAPLVLAALSAACAAQSAPASRHVFPKPRQRIDIAADLTIKEIGNGAFVVTHSFPWPANSLLVEMANSDLVIVGSTYAPEAMSSLLGWADAHFGLRRIVAINTGYHVDNLGGNAALVKRGVPIYGSKETADLLQRQGERTRKIVLNLITDKASSVYQAHARMVLIPPTRMFVLPEGLRLRFGNEQVVVFWPGPSQAPDKVVVYFPERRLLFGGCMILGGDKIGNVADADMSSWPDAVRALVRFPADVVVPGHGERLDPQLVQHTLDLLQP
jgi:glyoxylase-like metal-dependent hydrolase (beta-lactamase superfamily II)